MKFSSLFTLSITASLLLSPPSVPSAQADWPMWGRTEGRNMVSPEKGIPANFKPGTFKEGGEEVDLATSENVKWVSKLGSQSYGNPSVAACKVFVGTNNASPRDTRFKEDRGIVMCFDEKTGELLWQLAIPKLGAGKVSDWEYIGVCSSPAVEGNRAYVITNRCEVVCLDIEGMANGNDGPFQDEGKYMAGPGKTPITPGPKDADIIWVYDMRDELGVFPHNITSSSPLIVGDYVYTATSNGVDWSHTNIPSPFSPSLIALDKKTGELVGEEVTGSGKRVLHASWSSPSFGKVGGKERVFFGAGDGFVYALDTKPVKGEDDIMELPEIWRYDANPEGYREKDGKKIKYATYNGPSEVIGTPVFHEGNVYVAIGQDPEHGDGIGALSCLDAATGKVKWIYKDIGRTMSTVSISDGLIYAAEYAGILHCLDAKTGKAYWTHDTRSRIWASTLVADGKVYLGNEDGDVIVFAAGKEKKLLHTINVGTAVYASPIVANGTLYIASQTHLYAVSSEKK